MPSTAASVRVSNQVRRGRQKRQRARGVMRKQRSLATMSSSRQRRGRERGARRREPVSHRDVPATPAARRSWERARRCDGRHGDRAPTGPPAPQWVICDCAQCARPARKRSPPCSDIASSWPSPWPVPLAAGIRGSPPPQSHNAEIRGCALRSRASLMDEACSHISISAPSRRNFSPSGPAAVQAQRPRPACARDRP